VSKGVNGLVDFEVVFCDALNSKRFSKKDESQTAEPYELRKRDSK
jgi:hypothetical protein